MEVEHYDTYLSVNLHFLGRSSVQVFEGDIQVVLNRFVLFRLGPSPVHVHPGTREAPRHSTHPCCHGTTKTFSVLVGEESTPSKFERESDGNQMRLLTATSLRVKFSYKLGGWVHGTPTYRLFPACRRNRSSVIQNPVNLQAKWG